jgi:hypothetical protein
MIDIKTPDRTARPGTHFLRPRRLAPVAISVALSAALAAGAVLPTLAAAADPAAADQPATSIMHDEALAHANDKVNFVPGDAVTVPYRPRVGDTVQIDGAMPVALPAGRASGRSMAASPTGSTWAVPDAPATDSTDAAPATAATRPAAQTAPAATDGNVLRREVYGFIPYWEDPYAGAIQFDLLSTVAYFGVPIGGNGLLTKGGQGWGGWTSSWMTTLINNAHAHGTRVALTVESFAWTASEKASQVALLSDPAIRLIGAQQIAASVRDRGADGVNLDFEPIASGQGANYDAFVRTLRQELDKIHTGYEIVFCGTGSTGNYDAAGLTAAGGADAVFIMGYDFRTGSSSYAGSIDPLTSPRNVYDLTQVVKLWKARTDVSHIILGLPYYGIAWSTVDNKPNSTVRSGTGCSATSVLFGQAALLASQNGRNYDAVEQSAWTAYQLACSSTVTTWRELYYDDEQSLAPKYDLINYDNLRGMGIWALGYDYGHPELANLVAAKFLTDTNPPKAGIVDLPVGQSNEGFPVSWIGRDDWNGVANFDVQVSTDGGPFAAWLTATTATTSNFQGTTGHNYSFRVRATDGVGNVGPWDVTATYNATPAFATGGFLRVTAASTGERGLPYSSAPIVATATQGTILQILDGPVDAGNSIWYQVTGPVTEFSTVNPVFPGAWVVTSDVIPTTPPNTTSVSAELSQYQVGTPGMLPSGTGIDRGKVFSPDGDGIHDTLPIGWTNGRAYNNISLKVYDANGALAGTIDLGAQGAGPQTYTWNGVLGGGSTPLSDGTYMVQVVGTVGSSTDYAPSPAPFVAGQLSTLGVVIDTTPSGTYHTLAPTRILDTRKGTGPTGALVSGKARTFTVGGYVATPGGPVVVPANAIAVTGNLTVTGATAAGYVRLGPSTAGTASTINFKAGDDHANGVTLGLAGDGSLSALYMGAARSTANLLFDVTGYFVRDTTGATFFPVTPNRIVDTRFNTNITGALPTDAVKTFTVSGKAGVPPEAIAVTGNVTVVGQTSAGYVLVSPSITPGVKPTSSTLNFPLGDTRANNVTVELAAGKLQVEFVGKARTTTQFLFDVTGYFVPGLTGATFVPLAPGRVVDSRTPLGFRGPLKTGAAAQFLVSGQVSVHPIAVAVVGNLTVTGQTSYGWLSTGPAKTTTTSTLNFPVGDNRANGFVCLLGPNGSLTVTFGGTRGSSTQVVVDILGYYR